MSEDYKTVVVLGDMCITNHGDYWCVGKKCVDRDEYVACITVKECHDGVRFIPETTNWKQFGALFEKSFTYEQIKCVMDYWESRVKQ